MIIYNISGYEAVELVMKNWKIFRIGTDEPERLKEAIVESLLPHKNINNYEYNKKNI